MGKSLIGTFILLIIGYFLPCITAAQPINEDSADIVARRFLTRLQAEKSVAMNKTTAHRITKIAALTDPVDQNLLARIVHIEPKGFMIISAWRENDPVITYSFEQNWTADPDTGSFFMQLLLSDLRRDYKRSVGKAVISVENNISVFSGDEAFYQWPAQGTTTTSGWVKTKWIQGNPYNQFCPVDILQNTKSAVGCIATAIAQVVNYHQYIGGLRFDSGDQYTTNTRKITIAADSLKYDFPGFGLLNQYLRTIERKYSDKIALIDTEKAALCFSVGVALKMDYTGPESTIGSTEMSPTAPPLTNKLNYARADYLAENNEYFIPDLTDNMINGFPAILYLNNHAIICDGFNSEGYFHLNYGWAGPNPNSIDKTWYRPDSLPDRKSKIMSGILNLMPFEPDDDPQMAVNVKQLHFSCIPVGKNSESKNIILGNTGQVPLTIDDILLSGAFSLDISPAENTADGALLILYPGTELEIEVSCLPDRIGLLNGKIQIFASYAGVKRYLSVNLSAHGVYISGTNIDELNVSGKWEIKNAPYYINQNISIEEGGQLIIEKGTRVIFTGPYQLTVGPNVHFVARGTASDSVYFSGLTTQTGWRGISIKDSDDDDSLAYCKISDVRACWGQNALQISHSDPEITHTVFTDNRSEYYGGAVCFVNSGVRISDCVFRRNICTATDGGGAIHIMNNSTPQLVNLLLHDNQAVNGGAIYCQLSSPTMINLTVTNNWAEQEGGAIYLKGINALRIRNSIIWHNQAGLSDAPLLQKLSSPNLVLIDYSDIDTVAWEWLGGAISSLFSEAIREGEENSALDPLFIAQDAGDYRLQTNSPCIDSGDPYDDYYQEPEPNGGRINLGAYGGTGLAAITNITIAREQTRLSAFSLAQNYPNPFNPVTTINYGLPLTSPVDLSIYNVLGQKVANLVSEEQSAGTYQVQWDASGYAGGVYFYRLSAGSFVETKKLVLLR